MRQPSIGSKKTSVKGCLSEQVHISLGDSPSDVIVRFVTTDFRTPSNVYYSQDPQALSTPHIDKVTLASGTRKSFSMQLFIHEYLIKPKMGAPFSAESEILSYLDTSKWAFDNDSGEHFANWYNVTHIRTGFGQYNNPYMYYASPLIHTVTLSGLRPDCLYHYRVAGSCTIYSFRTLSSASSVPFRFALVGDLGQTEVSVNTIAALSALNASVILSTGDLSYAGVR